MADHAEITVSTHLVPSESLTSADLEEIRRLMDAAFEGDFDDHDWDHAVGGTHVVVRLTVSNRIVETVAGPAQSGSETTPGQNQQVPGQIVGHASVVARRLWVGETLFQTGYVEAVAVSPDYQRRGIGTLAMQALLPVVDEFELGALGTGELGFYQRLGWERWQGPSAVRTSSGDVRTPEDDGWIMIRRTPTTGPIDVTATIVCDARDGDVW